MPLAERGQGGDVVGEDRRHDPEPHREDAGDAGDVGGQDHRPASLHVAVEVAGDVAQLAELGEPLLQEHDVGRVGGDRRGAPQRDRHVGLLEGDRVVDAVAHEADLPAFLLELLDVVGLVGGENLGEVAVHPQRLGQLAGRRLVVARDDRDVLDAPLAQPLDDLADLGPDRRVQLDAPPSSPSTPTMTIVCPSRWASSSASCTSRRIGDASSSMNRLLPTRIGLAVDAAR